MNLEVEVITFDRRSYVAKDGTPKVYAVALVKTLGANSVTCELMVDTAVADVPRGKHTLVLALTAWQYKANIKIVGVK